MPAEKVDVSLSLDGGLTFPVQLALGLPNSGAASVVLPAGLSSDDTRIKVMASDNIFFGINPTSFSINTPALVGDLNGDGAVDVFDISALIVSLGSATPEELVNADINNDGVVNIQDAIVILEIVLG
ncbi:MAG: dockerin type I repeat-containing protein [Planctomycetota bacterium]